MKRLPAIFILLTLLTGGLFLDSSQALAQEPQETREQQIERARQDYLFQYANYTAAREEYATAKEAYVRFGTLVAQQEAIGKTKQVLSLRAEVLRTYLQLLKVILVNLPHLESGLREAQVGKIEATQAFLVTHNQNIQNTKSVLEVNAESQRLEREMEATLDQMYESLAYILIGEVKGLELRTGSLLEDALGKISSPTLSTEQGASQIRQLLTTIRVSLDRSTQTILDFYKEGARRDKMLKIYQQIQKDMKTSKENLEEAGQLLREIGR